MVPGWPRDGPGMALETGWHWDGLGMGLDEHGMEPGWSLEQRSIEDGKERGNAMPDKKTSWTKQERTAHCTRAVPRLDFGYNSKFQQNMLDLCQGYQKRLKLKSHR